MAVILIPSK